MFASSSGTHELIFSLSCPTTDLSHGECHGADTQVEFLLAKGRVDKLLLGKENLELNQKRM